MRCKAAREESFNGAVRRHLKRSGVPVENSKGEWGLGQHELNVRYADALTMADRHAVYKQCLKEVAEEKGVSVTFMAKFDEDHAGSSCHIHLSLFDRWDERLCRRWATWAGALFGRVPLVPGRLAASSAGDDGLLCADGEFVQTLSGRFVGADAHRLELRQPHRGLSRGGAWAEPAHRVTRARRGLQSLSGLTPPRCTPGWTASRNHMEPPPVFEGDVYQAAHLPHVPKTLHEALSLFEGSDFARRMFGAEVVEHYAHFFQVEQAAFDQAVTDWERRRYFERI